MCVVQYLMTCEVIIIIVDIHGNHVNFKGLAMILVQDIRGIGHMSEVTAKSLLFISLKLVSLCFVSFCFASKMW